MILITSTSPLNMTYEIYRLIIIYEESTDSYSSDELTKKMFFIAVSYTHLDVYKRQK